MFQIPSLALRINPGVGGWAVGQHVWNVPPTAPFPHAVKRKKRIRWHCSCRITKTTPTICFGICGTGTSTICCTIRFDIHSSGITLITSTCCSRIRGTGTSTICSICARPPVLSPDACTSVADDLTSNNLHDFLLDLWH